MKRYGRWKLRNISIFLSFVLSRWVLDVCLNWWCVAECKIVQNGFSCKRKSNGPSVYTLCRWGISLEVNKILTVDVSHTRCTSKPQCHLQSWTQYEYIKYNAMKCISSRHYSRHLIKCTKSKINSCILR